MTPHHPLKTSFLVIALIMVGGSGTRAANLLPNGSFQTPAPGVTPPKVRSFTSPPGGATSIPQSAAADWFMFINDYGGSTISTQLLPSTFPGAPAGKRMLHVVVSAYNSGVVNFLPKTYGGTLYTCAWIYVKHGAVGIGSGLAAYTEPNMILDRQGAWEVLNVGNQGRGGTGATNLTIVYAIRSLTDTVSVTDFYIDFATLGGSHSQCRGF